MLHCTQEVMNSVWKFVLVAVLYWNDWQNCCSTSRDYEPIYSKIWRA